MNQNSILLNQINHFNIELFTFKLVYLQIKHISLFTELNATSLLEGKLRNVQYSKERAEELQFLASLHSNNYECIGTGFVIAPYLVLTSNGALHSHDPITFVLISNNRRDVDKHLCESEDGVIQDSAQWGSETHHLAVLTVSNFMNLNSVFEYQRIFIDSRVEKSDGT